MLHGDIAFDQGPHCTAGDLKARHPSKPWTDSFLFMNTTAGLPTEELHS